MLPLERHQRSTRSLVALDQNSTIIAVIEMSQSSWLVAGMLPGIERQPRNKLEPSPERLGRQAGTCRQDPGKATESRCAVSSASLPRKRSAAAVEEALDDFGARDLRQHQPRVKCVSGGRVSGAD